MNQKDGEVRVLIEEIKGDIKLVMDRIEFLVKAIDKLSNTSVTREEFEIRLDPMEKRLKSLEEFKTSINKAFSSFTAIILIGLLGYILAKVIPGFSI